jgi:hypothetical protein
MGSPAVALAAQARVAVAVAADAETMSVHQTLRRRAVAAGPVVAGARQATVAVPEVLRSPSLFSMQHSTATNLSSLPKQLVLAERGVRASRAELVVNPDLEVPMAVALAAKVAKVAAAARAAAALVDTAWA